MLGRLLLSAAVCTWWCAQARPSGSDTDMRYVRACNQTSPVSLDTVNQVLVHKRLTGASAGSGEDALEEEYRFQCFLHCLFTKYGWMDEEGGFLVGEMRRVLEETLDEPPILHHLLYECTALKHRDRCHRALQFTRCFWEKLDQHPHPQHDTGHYNAYNLDEDNPEPEFEIWRR